MHSAAIIGPTCPAALPAIAVRRPGKGSPPPPVDTDTELAIPPGTPHFPNAPKAEKAERAVVVSAMEVEAPSATIDLTKKRKRASSTFAFSSPEDSIKRVGRLATVSMRPPLSPDRHRCRFEGSRWVCGSSSSPREGDVPLLQFEGSPWTDTQCLPATPPLPPSPPSLMLPDLSPCPTTIEGEAAAPASSAMSMSASMREMERGAMHRTDELLQLLGMTTIKVESEEIYRKNWTEEDEDDLVGLKFVSFDEHEEGSPPHL